MNGIAPYMACCCCAEQMTDSKHKCSRCCIARYCSTTCQLKHWPLHKKYCMHNNDAMVNDKAWNTFKIPTMCSSKQIRRSDFDLSSVQLQRPMLYIQATVSVSKFIECNKKKEKNLCEQISKTHPDDIMLTYMGPLLARTSTRLYIIVIDFKLRKMTPLCAPLACCTPLEEFTGNGRIGNSLISKYYPRYP